MKPGPTRMGAAILAVCALSGGSASAAVWTFTDGSAASGSVELSWSNTTHDLDITITNTLAASAIGSAANALSGVEISFSDPIDTNGSSLTGTAADFASFTKKKSKVTESQTGPVAATNILSGSPSANNPDPHWGDSVAGGEICLAAAVLSCTAGGQPANMILPDGSHTNANASLTNFNPSVVGAADFQLYLPDENSPGLLISGIFFQFGTGSGEPHGYGSGPGGVGAPVPEPSTWAMLALGFAALGYAGFRRGKKVSVSALA